MKLKPRETKAARIEMMPIIDIVFLLLVFFIYAMLSMAVHRGLVLDLPESSTASQTEENENISISIRPVGDELEITVDKKAVSLDDLGNVLPKPLGDRQPAILLFGDEDVSYQQLYMVLDSLKAIGFTTISLQASSE